MKYPLVIIFALFFNNLFSQAIDVNYVVKYDFYYTQDTSKLKVSEPFEFVLISNGVESRFHSSNRQFNDSMNFVYSKKHPSFEQAKSPKELQQLVDRYTESMKKWKKSSLVDYMILKNFEENSIKNKLSFAFPPQHMEIQSQFNWEISSEIDSFLNIKCIKAFVKYGGRNYKVWFAPEIPIFDGPYVFNGLPGLILKVKDDRGWYAFIAKEINVTPQKKYWSDNYISPDSKSISRELYVRQSKSFKNNPRFPGIANISEEEIVEKKRQYENRYFMLIEK